jgi:1-acyl-sn-glycerol-3-phosphate acyltransferase
VSEVPSRSLALRVRISLAAVAVPTDAFAPMNPTYWFFLRLAQIIAKTCFSLQVIGRENMPGHGGHLLAMNHQSYLDPPLAAIAASPYPIHFLARKTLLKWPLLGPIFPRLNVIPVDQERPDMSALKNVIRLLRAGETTVVFPEGARTLDGALQPAQPGIGLIIAKTLVPVVPIRVFGAFEAMPRNGSRIRMTQITLKIGRPLTFTAADLASAGTLSGRPLYQALSERVMTAIAAIDPP